MLCSRMFRFLFPVGLLGYLVSTSGCCDSCSELYVSLMEPAQNVSQVVQAEFQQVDGTAPAISCTWTLAEPSHRYAWNCTKDRNGKTDGSAGSSYLYNLSAPQKSWTIRLTGPLGTHTLTRTPRADTGEEWPSIRCSCDVYALAVSEDDIKSVGAVQSAAAPMDAGVAAARVDALVVLDSAAADEGM